MYKIKEHFQKVLGYWFHHIFTEAGSKQKDPEELLLCCYCYFTGQQNKTTSQQPEAEYEEIPGEEQKPQGAIEMKENTAYGPVAPRGGPVYGLTAGGGSGAVTTNRGIHMRENVAYRPVIPRRPEYEERNEGIETGGNVTYGLV